MESPNKLPASNAVIMVHLRGLLSKTSAGRPIRFARPAAKASGKCLHLKTGRLVPSGPLLPLCSPTLDSPSILLSLFPPIPSTELSNAGQWALVQAARCIVQQLQKGRELTPPPRGAHRPGKKLKIPSRGSKSPRIPRWGGGGDSKENLRTFPCCKPARQTLSDLWEPPPPPVSVSAGSCRLIHS